MSLDLSDRLLAALRCPESGRALSLAPGDLVDRLNAQIRDGSLLGRSGRALEGSITGGLLREDGALLYPIVDGFPVLLIDEAIGVGEGSSGADLQSAGEAG